MLYRWPKLYLLLKLYFYKTKSLRWMVVSINTWCECLKILNVYKNINQTFALCVVYRNHHVYLLLVECMTTSNCIFVYIELYSRALIPTPSQHVAASRHVIKESRSLRWSPGGRGVRDPLIQGRLVIVRHQSKRRRLWSRRHSTRTQIKSYMRDWYQKLKPVPPEFSKKQKRNVIRKA